MEFYKVGTIVNAHGIKGEVKIIATTDFSDQRFAPGATLYLQQAGETPQQVTVAAARPHKGTYLVKFKEVADRTAAEQLRKATVLVSEADQAAELDDGQYYYRQIIGLTAVTTEGRVLGTIKEILSPGANDVWVVDRPGQSDLLLPVIDPVIKKVNLAKGQVVVELMEGLE